MVDPTGADPTPHQQSMLACVERDPQHSLFFQVWCSDFEEISSETAINVTHTSFPLSKSPRIFFSIMSDPPPQHLPLRSSKLVGFSYLGVQLNPAFKWAPSDMISGKYHLCENISGKLGWVSLYSTWGGGEKYGF